MKIILCLLGLIAFSANADIEKTVDQIVSAFENSSTKIQYGYIQNIHDGRGYTAGRAGFTTATGDLYVVVKKYVKVNPESKLKDLLPVLKKRADDESDDVTGLEDLPRLWKAAAHDPKFIDVQDDVVETLYKNPARKFLKKYGLTTNLAYLVFFDTVIQEGYSDDPDSFQGVIKRMDDHPTDEAAFLEEFLKARFEILSNASDPNTREEWKKSVDRVRCLKRLLKASNLDLEPPFHIKVWGDDFTIRE